jgi:hypothetical protein
MAVVSARAWVVVAAVAALLAATIALTYASSRDTVTPSPVAVATGALTPTDANRIDATERAAIEALRSPAGAPEPSGHGHGDLQRYDQVPLSPSEQQQFDGQWAAAAAAASRLSTKEAALAAGYVPAAVWGAGIGTHYVKWSLIDRPFDPARPSMLLIDDRNDRPSRLVGFSYWVRSATEPAGFAGVNDHWHQHAGDCVVNGWIDGENVPNPSRCAGVWLAGGDLWMLHAWIVPGLPNRWGQFATIHPALCPSAARTPDFERCPISGFTS